MPGKKDIPKQVKDNLPAHAEEIWEKAYESSKDEYADRSKRRNKGEDRKTVAAKIAWSAVKKAGYRKKNGGNWGKSS